MTDLPSSDGKTQIKIESDFKDADNKLFITITACLLHRLLPAFIFIACRMFFLTAQILPLSFQPIQLLRVVFKSPSHLPADVGDDISAPSRLLSVLGMWDVTSCWSTHLKPSSPLQNLIQHPYMGMNRFRLIKNTWWKQILESSCRERLYFTCCVSISTTKTNFLDVWRLNVSSHLLEHKQTVVAVASTGDVHLSQHMIKCSAYQGVGKRTLKNSQHVASVFLGKSIWWVPSVVVGL